MADRAGCLIGIRLNAGPVIFKVTRFEFDPEVGVDRSTTSDAGCHPRSVRTGDGGILRLTGFVDPLNAGSALVLATPGGAALTACKFLIDTSELTGARHGYDLGVCELIPGPVSGETRPGGMSEQTIEIHSQGGTAYSSTLV